MNGNNGRIKLGSSCVDAIVSRNVNEMVSDHCSVMFLVPLMSRLFKSIYPSSQVIDIIFMSF